jgi:tetratricopeptide (TPR) repeat protein
MAKQATARHSPPAYSIERALSLHRKGLLDEAQQIYDTILAVDPEYFPALHLCGLLNYQQGRFSEALRYVAAALKAQPASADALRDYGAILMALDRAEEALASYDRLLPAHAADSGVHYNRGNAQKRLGRHADALASYDRAIALAPNLSAAHHNRGSMLAELGRNEEALASFERALSLAPTTADRIEALANRGQVLIRLDRPEAVLANYDALLALAPDRAGVAASDIAEAHVNRGNAFVALNRMEEALTCFTAAAALSPRHAAANFNEGLTRLCLGDFRGGWKKYEHRWEIEQYKATRPDYPRPLWHGESDIGRKTILLCAEQGMGDVLQFVRYAPLVAALGAKVLLGVHPPLTRLLESVSGVSQVIPDGGTLPDFDLYCPLLSLPLALGTELATIPAKVPYVRADEARVAKWRDRLPSNGRLRIGLCWAGTSKHINNRNRSIPLSQFVKLLAIPGLDFVCLQKEIAETDASILRDHGVVQFGEELEDFSDTAAVMTMLDLVITVDTAVAHLAGAMGKATAVLIPFAPDFRWLRERTDSPWYPTLRLFRQSVIGDWHTPLDRLHQELGAVAARQARPL